jgi:arylsulfatase A-like enzyme
LLLPIDGITDGGRWVTRDTSELVNKPTTSKHTHEQTIFTLTVLMLAPLVAQHPSRRYLQISRHLPRRKHMPFNIRMTIFAASVFSASALVTTQAAANPPNIVVILTDDQGYADISFNPQHPPEVSTPHMDALAGEGVFFSQAYTSGNVCSPTRAGLMTGRYQQRYGIYTAGEGGSGLPLDARIFPQFLKPAGYVCGALGKWHLGLTPQYNPASRGFDEFYGFLGRGAHDYFKLDNPDSPLYRNLQPIEDEGYLTTRLTDEAVSFIERRHGQPFYLHLAYNAVHAPAQAPAEDVKKFNTADPDRDTLMAMLKHLDLGVGRVIETLKKQGVWENTLLFFLTDNGGSRAMHANNAPLRGFKQQNYEGGIRTPFIVSWPARFKGGRTVDTPVISLDILPTALAAAGVSRPENEPLDGRNLLPLLLGDVQSVHDALFWSEGGSSGEWAVRSGNWKVLAHKKQRELFDLAADPGETKDLAAQSPEVVKQLENLYDEWLNQMAEPMKKGTGKRWDDVAKP